MPYYMSPHCDGECRGPHGPPPAPPPAAPHSGSGQGHGVLIAVLLLVGLAAVGGAGWMGLRYKRERDQQKSYKEMGPRLGDPLLQ